MASPRRRRAGMLVKVILGLIASFVVGDFVYSRVIAYRHATWESGLRRDENGVRDGCNEFSVGSGDTAILLVHGINDSPHFYHKMAGRLADAGFACHAMRLPGFAQPSHVYAQSLRTDWVDAVGMRLRDLRGAHPRVHVVAHSLGAAVVIRHLLDDPTAADSVVLLAPGIAVGSRRSPLFPPRLWHELSRRTLCFTQLTESPFGIDAEDPEEARSPYRTPFTPRATIHETFLLFDENRGHLDAFRTPMLMVLGAHDRVIDVDAAKAFYEQASSTPKQLLIAPDSAHALAVDYGWESTTDEIVQFIQAAH